MKMKCVCAYRRALAAVADGRSVIAVVHISRGTYVAAMNQHIDSSAQRAVDGFCRLPFFRCVCEALQLVCA